MSPSLINHQSTVDALIDTIVAEQGQIVGTTSPEQYIHVTLAVQALRTASAHLLVAAGAKA